VVDDITFVNTGSVGRPKDGDWRAGYVRLTLGAGARPAVEFVRVPYDLARTVAGIRAAGLPEDFVAFLETGGRPGVPAAGEVPVTSSDHSP
jgi:diadenosine tetraphosphatase ApaH/serine/threonine PP2A family protein phosphatase